MTIRDLKINKDIVTPSGRRKAGIIISVQCDINNIPLNKFWRDRVKDSEIDGCVSFVERDSNKTSIENIDKKTNKKKRNK
jgi:hypothetical protein